MTAEIEHTLEQHLADLTKWKGESPQAWRRALDEAEREDAAYRPNVVARILTMPLPRLAAAAAIVLLVSVVAIVIVLPSLSKARNTNSAALYSMQQGIDDYGGERVVAREAPQFASTWNDRQTTYTDDNLASYDFTDSSGLYLSDDVLSGGAGGGISGGIPGDRRQIQDSGPLTPGRSVIRKADITLLVEDARVSFLRASMLINDAVGEYIEDSSLTEDHGRPRATIKLRVTAERLSEVLQALRELGEVKTEQMRGDDVTEQIVDLDARLRNEQRFEQELLELLDTRDDSPLKEVLDLRDRISNVRQQIEQLQARQQQLSRMVSLATVLVVLYEEPPADPEPEEDEEESTLGSYFADAVSGSWTTGLEFLADTVAMLIRVIVGGLIWWLIAIGALIGARRMAQRKIADAATA